MENNNFEYIRPLPLELLVEMHKCLPLAAAINVLVNVPSYAFVETNKPRMLRTIQQIKTSLNEYIDTLVEAEDDDEEENDRELLAIYNKIEWKPEMDALLRYGSWLTSKRKFYSPHAIGIPENFMKKLLLHLANPSSTQMMLQIANFDFACFEPLPLPTFLKPLFNEKQFRVGSRCVFDSVELKTDDGQILCIHDGELIQYGVSRYKLRFVQNKMNGNEWFKITMDLNSEFIHLLKFKQWQMQSLEDVNKFIQKDDNSFEEKDGNILEAKKDISFNPNLDLFLRRGAKFTQFRHLKINKRCHLQKCPKDYVDFLINFVSNAKYPEEFLETINFDLFIECSSSIKKLWEICQKGILKDGKFVHFDEKKLYIFSAKYFEEHKLKFTLANLPTNGEYLFDFSVKFVNGLEQIFGIKIQRRKNDDKIGELNCNEQIEKKQLGMKKNTSNDDGKEEDEDEPTCSSKILKK